MDGRALEILTRFEARADEIAEEIAACTVAEVDGFGPINDVKLHGEIRMLARRHLDAYLHLARTGHPPPPEMLDAARERAKLRAREMVPLAAQVHSYLIAQRVIGAAITHAAGPDLATALALTAQTFEYNRLATAAMADAYVEVVQGDLADLDSARRGLVDALLTRDGNAWPALMRRAIGVGFDPDHDYVVVLALVDLPDDHDTPGSLRWAAQAIARASGRPERSAFVVSRERDIVALLDASSGHPPRLVLERAAATIEQTHAGARLRAGVGTPFAGLGGFSDSYQEARRALKHATNRQPIVFGPDDVRLFDELTTSSGNDNARLIPTATRQALADDTTRATIEALFACDLNVADAATALSLHPNSLRYRLKRIAEATGRDPRKLSDLLELIAASRLIAPHAARNGDPAPTASEASGVRLSGATRAPA